MIGGHDPADSTSLNRPTPRVLSVLDDGVAGLTVGVLTEFLDGADPDVAARVRQAAEACAAAGARVEEISVPEVTLGLSAYYLIAPGEASSNLARYDGVRYGLRVDAEDTVAMNTATRSAGFGAEVKRRIMLGTYVLSAGYMDAYYNQALRVRTRIIEGFDAAYGPATSCSAPPPRPPPSPSGPRPVDPLTMYLSDVCTIPSNLAGHPAISVPFGPGDDGLPVGVQLLGPALSESTLFKVAAVVEAAAPDLAVPRIRPGSGHEGRTGRWSSGSRSTASSRRPRSCSAGAPTSSATSPTPTSVRSAWDCRGRCRCSTSGRSSWPWPSAPPSTARSARRPSTARTTSTPTRPRTTRSASTTSRSTCNGHLDLPDGIRVGIERAHMEEDTGKTTHAGASGRIHGADYSLVDYNRSGRSPGRDRERPDMRSADQARAYVTELRAVLVASGASDGKMEEGSMRVDANVSVRRSPDDPFGTRCEIKNLNSVRSLGRAIEYEAERQIALLESGEQVVQQTRHWDEDAGRTQPSAPRRTPTTTGTSCEPDLVPLVPDADWIRAVADTLGTHAGRAPGPAGRAAGARPAGPTASSSDQVATVVDLGLDDLVIEAVAGGVGSALALARTANEAATDPDAARRLSTAGPTSPS